MLPRRMPNVESESAGVCASAGGINPKVGFWPAAWTELGLHVDRLWTIGGPNMDGTWTPGGPIVDAC